VVRDDLGWYLRVLASRRGGHETRPIEGCAILHANERYQGFRFIFLQLRISYKAYIKRTYNYVATRCGTLSHASGWKPTSRQKVSRLLRPRSETTGSRSTGLGKARIEMTQGLPNRRERRVPKFTPASRKRARFLARLQEVARRSRLRKLRAPTPRNPVTRRAQVAGSGAEVTRVEAEVRKAVSRGEAVRRRGCAIGECQRGCCLREEKQPECVRPDWDSWSRSSRRSGRARPKCRYGH
jgi:hypothetical protein